MQRGDRGPFRFSEIENSLRDLLQRYGPPRTTLHPEYAFIRLVNDGIWQIEIDGITDPIVVPTQPLLQEQRVRYSGGFSPEVASVLVSRPRLVSSIALDLLHRHFPASLHEEILDAVGLDIGLGVDPRVRDPLFRERILRAYGYRCAVTGYDGRIGTMTVGIDAAHIMWHTSGGPDTEANGLAINSLHHKLFDLGAFSITDDRRIIVSQFATGDEAFQSLVISLHGQMLRNPIAKEFIPKQEFLAWHRSEVFRHPARPL